MSTLYVHMYVIFFGTGPTYDMTRNVLKIGRQFYFIFSNLCYIIIELIIFITYS